MDSGNLKPWQLDRIGESIGRHVPILRGIANALDRRIPGSPVAKAAAEAYSAARGLSITLHYLSCASGVGRPARTVKTSGAFAAWAGLEP